jgi:hypothetical protein
MLIDSPTRRFFQESTNMLRNWMKKLSKMGFAGQNKTNRSNPVRTSLGIEVLEARETPTVISIELGSHLLTFNNVTHNVRLDGQIAATHVTNFHYNLTGSYTGSVANVSEVRYISYGVSVIDWTLNASGGLVEQSWNTY